MAFLPAVLALVLVPLSVLVLLLVLALLVAGWGGNGEQLPRPAKLNRSR